MTWVILGAALVLAAAFGAAYGARRLWDEPTHDRGERSAHREGSAPADAARVVPADDHIPTAFPGYRMDQVDDVLDRLESAVREREVALGLIAPPAPVIARSPARTLAVDVDPALEQDHPRPARPSTLVARLAGPPLEATGSPRAAKWRFDLAVLAAYLLFAGYLFSRLLARPGSGYLDQGVQDQQLFEWFLGVDARVLTHAAHPFFTNLQNYPDGVNLMANTALLGIGLPLTPLTLVLGSWWAYVTVAVVGMGASAWAWYWLFWRRAGVSRPAAIVAGWLAGFAPGMVSHANGHLNFTSLFVLPLIIDRLCALHERKRPVRDGLLLGLLVSWQILIGEEPLLLAAIALVIVGFVLVLHGRVRTLPLGRGLLIGAGTSLVVVAYPLWTQFFGRQSYTSLWHPPGGNDLAALWGRATRSVGADPWAAAALSMNRTEENSFFGPFLLLVALAVVVALWRRPLVRALGVLIVLSCWLSLGEEVRLHDRPVGLPALWAAFDSLPVVENVLPTRFALLAVPAFALLLALGLDAARRHSRGVLLGAVTAVAIAVVSVMPTPVSAADRPAVPEFFTTDLWRDYVADGSVLAVPPPAIADARAFDWQLAAGMSFPLVEGYFVGPNSPTDRGGRHGALRKPLSEWLWAIADGKAPPSPTAAEVEQFRADLAAWRVDAMVLPERAETPALLAGLTEAFGPPRQLGGVYVWDARALRGTP